MTGDTNHSEKIKTTINIPESLWEHFTIKVIRERGGRKNSEVIEEQIRKYVKGEIIL